MKYHTYRKDIIEELDILVSRQIAELWAIIQNVKANMSVAVLCMNLIEFLGGISNGELGIQGKVKSRFLAGVKMLGKKYILVGFDNMYALRNSLTHQYVAKTKDFREVWIINDWPKTFWYCQPGYEDDEIWPPVKYIKGNIVKDSIMVEGDIIWLNVVVLTRDIQEAWQILKEKLEHDDILVGSAEISLHRLPKLSTKVRKKSIFTYPP